MAEDELSPNNSGRIIGRERERAQLRALLTQVRQGQGALALVSGSAGIGKTTLVNDLMQAAREEGSLVLSGGCYALTSTPPYGLWAELFRDYQPDDGMPHAPPWLLDPTPNVKAESERALHDELRRFLRDVATDRATLLVLEDIHWSDPASLEALRYIARQHHRPPVLIVGTFRHDEVAPHHPLYRLLPLIARESGALRIELQPFKAEEIRALVSTRYDLDPDDESRFVDDLQSRTAGNPFFVTELLHVFETERLLEESDGHWRLGDLDEVAVPPLVRHAIEGWLARLTGEDRRLLEIAAVIGHDLSPEVWGGAGGVSAARIAEAADRAVEAHLMVPDSGPQGVRFTHALVQETLYQRLPLARRRALHRDVAEILADQPNPTPGAVGSHYAQADDPRAIRWLLRAGERALALYAARDAVDAFGRAYDLAARFSETLSAENYLKRASAFAMLGEFEHAREDLDVVLERGRQGGDQVITWKALVDLGMLWAERDYDRAGRYTRESLELAQTIGDRRMIARSLNQVANWHVNRDEPQRAVSMHEEALAHFEELDDQAGIAVTLDLLGLATYLSQDWSTSVEYYERAIELLRELGDRQRLSSSLATITLCAGGVGDDIAVPVYREAAYWSSCLEEALAIAREIDWPAGEAYALISLALASGGWGEFDRAQDAAGSAFDIAEAIDHREWMTFARFALGSIQLEMLDYDGAQANLEAGLALARRSSSHFWINMTVSALASLYVATGKYERAEAHLQSAELGNDPDGSMGARRCLAAGIELDLARGNAEGVLDVIATLSGPEPSQSPRNVIPGIEMLRGHALARLGRLDEAEQAYEVARDSASLFGLRALIWQIDAALGALFQRSGRTLEAADAYRHARTMIDRLAANIEDERHRERFQKRAVARLSPEQRGDQPSGSAANLSPREFDVLRHLVEGKSDREIAEELSISPRTVMRHVGSILRKLDVPTRTAAATMAVRQGLI